jgi:hypothetical protein
MAELKASRLGEGFGRLNHASDSSDEGILPTFDSSSSSDDSTAVGCLTNSFGLWELSAYRTDRRMSRPS